MILETIGIILFFYGVALIWDGFMHRRYLDTELDQSLDQARDVLGNQQGEQQ